MGGFGAGWSPPPFQPALSPYLVEGWNVTTLAGTTPGTIGSWTGVRGTVATLVGGGGTTRSYDPVGIVADDGTLHPGVAIANGAQMNCPVGAALSALGTTRIAVVLGTWTTNALVGVVYEYGTPNFLGNGRFGLTMNNVAAADLGAVAYGGGGFGQWLSPAPTVPVVPCTLTVVFDWSDATGVGTTSRRLDNVEIAGGTTPATALVPGSTVANQNLYVGARDGGTFPSQIWVSSLWILNNPSEVALTQFARYADRLLGEVAA